MIVYQSQKQKHCKHKFNGNTCSLCGFIKTIKNFRVKGII